MVNRLTVRHSTVYRYRRAVTFNAHRLMFRPRDSHDLQLIETRLAIWPPALVQWHHDVFGNSIAVATFGNAASELVFESVIVLDHYGSFNATFPVDPSARTVPFAYSQDDLIDLGHTAVRHYPDPEGRVEAWARGFLGPDGRADTEGLVLAITQAISRQFAYTVRNEPGTQPPAETLAKRSGTCRDYALLMMEALRSVGIAAQFVTGYLYDPGREGAGPAAVGAGATHAWVQVYLPGAGWIECDPTNGLMGGGNLIRVAVARDPAQAIPLTGSFVGAPDDFLSMSIDVQVATEQGSWRPNGG